MPSDIPRAIKYAKKKARELGLVGTIMESPLPAKKLRFTFEDGSFVDFGSKISQTFAEGASQAKMNLYRARHSKLMIKDGRRAIDIKYSPSWFSWHLLW
jgi:hypothetical protein